MFPYCKLCSLRSDIQTLLVFSKEIGVYGRSHKCYIYPFHTNVANGLQWVAQPPIAGLLTVTLFLWVLRWKTDMVVKCEHLQQYHILVCPTTKVSYELCVCVNKNLHELI